MHAYCCRRIPDNIAQAQKEVGTLKQTVSRGTDLHLNEVCSSLRMLHRFPACLPALHA